MIGRSRLWMWFLKLGRCGRSLSLSLAVFVASFVDGLVRGLDFELVICGIRVRVLVYISVADAGAAVGCFGLVVPGADAAALAAIGLSGGAEEFDPARRCVLV